MTEDQAKEKWCPMAIYKSFGNSEQKPSHHNHRIGSSCVASDCMMWQWKETLTLGPGSSGMVDISDTDGYCGLAGKL